MTNRGELRPGDRVRAKVRTMSGWKGTGTVVEADTTAVVVERDGAPPGAMSSRAELCRHEVTKIRKGGETIVNITDSDTLRDAEGLIDAFKQGPLRLWTREEIERDKLLRFARAYLTMARAGYRPAAPSDGLGNIQLSLDQCRDPQRLHEEAVKYALAFARQEDCLTFRIGCSNYDTNRAFVLCIEAARLLCAGDADKLALRLLNLAIEEIEVV
jgi:hypothetical protein